MTFFTVIYSAQVPLKILYDRVYIYIIVSVLAVFLATRNRDLLMEKKKIVPFSFHQESCFTLQREHALGHSESASSVYVLFRDDWS